MKQIKTALLTFLVFSLTISSLFLVHFNLIQTNLKDIDPEFQPLYESFLYQAELHGHDFKDLDISIKFNSLTPDQLAVHDEKFTLGHCSLLLGQTPTIRINPLYWSRLSPTKREMTIFHELGHCFLMKGHTERLHQSLMNPSIFSEEIYLQNREFYLKELFFYRPYHVRDYLQTFFIAPAKERIMKKLSQKSTARN